MPCSSASRRWKEHSSLQANEIECLLELLESQLAGRIKLERQEEAYEGNASGREIDI
jgi:hypothetical protein